MPEAHLLKLADFFKDWRDLTGEGPHSACVAGGGEPLMNPGTMAFLERMHSNGLENGFITNGSLLTDEKIKILAKTCRWVGFSMDAATSETWMKVKGIKAKGLFAHVVKNIQKLVKASENTKNDVCYKFLLHPYNADEIYTAALLAKTIGCKDFHLRPVGWENLTIVNDKEKLNFASLMDNINSQIELAQTLETKDFHVYGIRHKFHADFSKGKKNFERCWAIPMLPTFGADGNVHTCFDMRGREDLIMCRHDPDPTELLRYWNSPEHKELIRTIKVEECPRCTFSSYNEAVEQVIIQDSMCYKFP
jgi:MoaA/NifB/PqqE/SkfB family radical SAM enzyme